jgi:hypothetical protein
VGVGAIFIATLAAEKLPHPEEPPRSQADYLAVAIEPVVAFIVMCSILIRKKLALLKEQNSLPFLLDGLSIPFFSLGRRVHSVTMTRTLSLRGRHEPEWATQTRKVTRPEDIVINRDHEPGPSPPTEKEIEEGRVRASSSDIDTAKTAEQTLDYECEEKGELVRKWREGRHLVIEHHSKEPGAEVSQILDALPVHLMVPARCKLRSFITPSRGPSQISKKRSISSQRHHIPSEMKSSSTCTPSLAPRPPTRSSNRLRSL